MLFEERTYVRAYEWNVTFPHLKPVIELQLPRVAGSESRTPGRQWGRNGPCWCWMSDCNCDSQWRHRLCELQNNKSTPLTHCYHRLKANATILAVILLHLAISDFDVLGTFFFFFLVFCFVKASIWTSYLLFPFIILQTHCAAFNSGKMSPPSRQTVIAANSFAASNYLDYPLLITAFSQRDVYRTHLTHSVRKTGCWCCSHHLSLEGWLEGGDWKQHSPGSWRFTQPLTKTAHFKHHHTFGHFISRYYLWHSRVHVQVGGWGGQPGRPSPPREKPSGSFSSL